MKFCDRCYKEYNDDEIVQFDKESPKWICLPCKWEFDIKLKFFLIEFFNSQPERLNPEARKGFDSLNSVETQRESSEEGISPGNRSQK